MMDRFNQTYSYKLIYVFSILFTSLPFKTCVALSLLVVISIKTMPSLP